MDRLRPMALAALLLLPACRSTEQYRVEADDEVYALLEERRAALAADPGAFTVDPPQNPLRERLEAGEMLEHALSLAESLEIAAENSRDFQDRREALYLAALDLTLERFRFGWIESAGGSARLDAEGFDSTSASAGASAGLTKLLGTGAQIVSNIGLSLFRLAKSGDTFRATSDLSLSITQPLLRGAGSRVVLEPLTQAERDLIYEVRSYERFRRSFALDVASRYFRLLATEDTLANEVKNHEELVDVRERSVELARAGELSEIQADQASQDELRARNRVIDARQSLESQLDDFKLFLGLPIDAEIAVDRAELDALAESGLVALGWAEDDVIELALARRLDYLTTLDRVDDAARAVVIAADALRPGLSVGASVGSTSEEGQPLDHDASRTAAALTLDLDLPIGNLAERNAYRRSLIRYEQAERSAVELADVIRADLRDTLRNLVSLRQSYENERAQVELNERRVDNASLRLEAGRAETRDLLEAKDDYVQAQNAATQTLVDYYLAARALFRDMEILRVDESGIGYDPVDFDEAP